MSDVRPLSLDLLVIIPTKGHTMLPTSSLLYYLDADGINSHLLVSHGIFQRVLWAIADTTGLRIMSSGVQEFPNPNLYGAGLTGWAVLAESGMMVHGTTERGAVQVEVHSCRSFNHDLVREVICSHFNPGRIIREGVVDRSLPAVEEVAVGS